MRPTPHALTRGHEPRLPDAWLNALIDRSVQFVVQHLGPDTVEAVILTGSVARGEASILPSPTGSRLLGDLEFLVILKAPFDWATARRRLSDLGDRATQELGEGNHRATIEYGPAGRVYLERNIRPCIFAYDLKTHGQVLWGPSDILTAIPPFDVKDIPREDALNLLLNRLVELLLLQATPDSSDHGAYHLIKVMLDLAGSALAFTGQHVSCYQDRAAPFHTLLQSNPSLASALPESFCHVLDQAVTCKLQPTTDQLEQLSQRVPASQLITWGQALWLWELQHVVGVNLSSLRSALRLYLAQESRVNRLKGWLKFFQHPLRPPGTLDWLRVSRLFFRASPQRLTYAAALLTQTGLTGQTERDWQSQVAALTPIPLAIHSPTQAARDIGGLWQWLIRNN